MSKTILFLATLSMIVLTGCIPLALNPFYAEKDLSYDPALVGLWGEKDEGAQVRFEANGAKGYWMTDLKADTALKFEAHLFKIGDKLFLDLYPKSTGIVNNDLLEIHLIRAHSLVRVDQIVPTLVTAGLDKKWLTEMLSKDAKALPHVISDDQLVLTATTTELQAFVLKHLGDENAFEKPSEMYPIAKK